MQRARGRRVGERLPGGPAGGCDRADRRGRGRPHREGKVKFEETADPSGKKWAKRGAIAGGIVGLIFPPSIIVSAAVAGGAGGMWGKIRDKGFKDEDLKEIGKSLSPGSSAIIVVAEDRMVEQLERALGGYERIAKHAVSAEAAAAIVAEVEDSE